MKSAVLQLNCPDSRGIVYNVSKFLYELGANIIDAQQYTEELDNRFFMRVHFDRAGMSATREALEAGLHTLAGTYQMETSLAYSEDVKRMAVMVSAYDHCLYDLFLRHRYGELPVEIACVVSNHDKLRGVAESFGVPFHHIPVPPGKKGQAEQACIALLQSLGVDFVVLARYMQVLSPLMVDAFRNKIINVHHGFLPAFKGAKPYHQAYEYGVKVIGATSHYVTDELDMGPIIAQEIARVDHTHRVDDLVAMGRDIEKRVLAAAVKAHAEDRIMVFRRRTIVFD